MPWEQEGNVTRVTRRLKKSLWIRRQTKGVLGTKRKKKRRLKISVKRSLMKKRKRLQEIRKIIVRENENKAATWQRRQKS